MTKPKLAQQEFSRRDQLVDWISGAAEHRYPDRVLDAARKAFTDYLAVTVGSMQDAPVKAVAAAIRNWRAPGEATIFRHFRTAPALAALVNGTATHSQDYDDTHPLGCGHPSGPCWSAALAMGEALGASGEQMIGAFITGYEVMARLGGGGVKGVGRALQRHGFHPTSIVGRAGAAAVTSVLLRLDPDQTGSALGNAATTAGGLVGSFGSHSKPFHAGKAAMDGIMAAQYAQEHFQAAQSLYELEGGWLSAFIQDASGIIPPLDDFGANWEILGNGFKLFASCRATHASTETAMRLADRVGDRPIKSIHVKTHGHALVTAGKLFPKTALEGKFSVPFCVALGLRGYRLVPSDFVDRTLQDASVMRLLDIIKVEPVVGQSPAEAHVEIVMEDGEVLRASTKILKGHPDNPLTWEDLKAKFDAQLLPLYAAPVVEELFGAAREIDSPGAMATVVRLAGPPV